MANATVEPLSHDPAQWLIHDMWRFVNALDDARNTGRLPNNHAILAVQSESGARAINLTFSRPARVAQSGWSWDNHHHDEQVEIAFGKDAITLAMCISSDKILISRVVVILAITRIFANTSDFSGPPIWCSLGDSDGDQPVLCFSSKTCDDFLIPDPYFMLTRCYEQEREYLSENWVDFSQRDPRMYWRGMPSGLAKYSRQLDSQRVKLVLLANRGDARGNYNVRFAKRDGLEDNVRDLIESAGGFSEPEDQMQISRYAYNIDVDGVSSSWTGFFLKLLAGGAVIKIESDAGYRQWYYKNLKAWVHYARVSADLADFGAVGRLLTRRRDWAEDLAQAGRDFALSLDLPSQLKGALKSVERAISLSYKSQ